MIILAIGLFIIGQTLFFIEMFRPIKRFVNTTGELTLDIEVEFNEAISLENYEKAAILRDKLKKNV